MPAIANPRFLAISPLPPDLFAVLKDKYGMIDYTTLGGAPGKPVPAPGFDIAVTMGVYGIDAALDGGDAGPETGRVQRRGSRQDRPRRGAGAWHRGMPYAG